jgi:catechol 2,3-dioxygenase-like lactoylglutathione lyase family enzyme
LADGDIGTIRAEVEAKGWPVEEGPVERHGACGVMDSIYLRDPDGNLVEIGVPGKAAGPSSR